MADETLFRPTPQYADLRPVLSAPTGPPFGEGPARRSQRLLRGVGGTPFPARASPSIRRTVASPTRSRGAAARMHRAPASKATRTAGHARRTSGRSARGRPKCRPCRRARSIPALTRSRSTLRELGVGDGDVVDGLTERRRGVEPRFLVGAEPDASGSESLQGLGRIQDRPEGRSSRQTNMPSVLRFAASSSSRRQAVLPRSAPKGYVAPRAPGTAPATIRSTNARDACVW